VIDMMITLHFILSLFLEDSSTNNTDITCMFDGYLTAYTYVTSVSYNICLAHCILQTIVNFQPKKRTSGWIYHLFSITAGFFYIGVAAMYDDIGQGVMMTCAMGYGTYIE
jgi:hypothetical protein